jgi:hypothetical protein
MASFFLVLHITGVSVASYGEMLVTITKAAGFGSDTGLIHSLRTQSSELRKLAHDFSDIYDTLEIFCFCELLPSKFGHQVRLMLFPP